MVVADTTKINEEPPLDLDEIQRTLRILHPVGTFELRGLGKKRGFKKSWASYWRGPLNDAGLAYLLWLDKAKDCHSIYCTLNPVVSDAWHRYADQWEEQPDATTKDFEIEYRRWLLLDFDPNRLSLISSTNAEKAASIEVRDMAVEWLMAQGFGEPIFADSGNGGHALFPINLPNDDASAELVKRVLNAVAQHFGDESVPNKHRDTVTIDISVSNASRITKLYGTFSGKGSNTEERPHRRSKLNYVPDYLENGWREPTPKDVLARVASLYIEPPKAIPRSTPNGHSSPRKLLVDRYLDRKGIEYSTGQDGTVTKYLMSCVFEDRHSTASGPRDLMICQDASGLITAHCFHASCQTAGMCWSDVRQTLGEPDAEDYDRPQKTKDHKFDCPTDNCVTSKSYTSGQRVRGLDRGNVGTVVEDDGGPILEVHFDGTSQGNGQATIRMPRHLVEPIEGAGSDEHDDGPPLRLVTVWELEQENPSLRPILIEGLLRRGETCNIISASKTGKSWLAAGLAWSIQMGREYLGRGCTRGNVLAIDNELHKQTATYRYCTVAQHMGIGPTDGVGVTVVPVRGRSLDIHAVSRLLSVIDAGRFDLIILDALYRFYPEGISENDNAQITRLYNKLDEIADRLDSAIVVVHHSSKGDQSTKSITDIGSGAGAISRAADSHLIIRPHELAGCAVVEAVTRSFPPPEPITIQWQWPLWLPRPMVAPSPAQSGDRKQERKDADGVAHLLSLVPEEGEVTVGYLREATGFGSDRVNRLLAVAIQSGSLTDRRGDPIVAGKQTRYVRQSRTNQSREPTSHA